MPVSALSVLDPDALKQYVDLRSVPNHRFFGQSDLVDRLRNAVPFDYIIVSGLDVDHYRFGGGLSIDTDLPPAFIEAYMADNLSQVDPFVAAAKASRDVVIEADVYATREVPQRLLYLQRTFNVHNRTIIPICREDAPYGTVGFTRTTPFNEQEIAFLQMVAKGIYKTFTKQLHDRFITDHMKLSKGELACLVQASLGLTSENIAKATGYQAETVNSYIKSATKKLGAANRTQAIAEAIRRKIID